MQEVTRELNIMPSDIVGRTTCIPPPDASRIGVSQATYNAQLGCPPKHAEIPALNQEPAALNSVRAVFSVPRSRVALAPTTHLGATQ